MIKSYFSVRIWDAAYELCTTKSKPLFEEMKAEIKRNGYSDLTLKLEGYARGIYEIIELNAIDN